MRERLRRSARPDRVFEAALTAARQAGLVGRRRVLDSTPLYDAVATMDTVTLIRSASRYTVGANVQCGACGANSSCGKGCPAAIISRGSIIGDVDHEQCPVSHGRPLLQIGRRAG